MKYGVLTADRQIAGFRFNDQEIPERHIPKDEDGKPLWLPIFVTGIEEEYDHDLQERSAPVFEIGETHILESYSIAWREDARERMIEKVEKAAEARRAAYITALPGNIMEYTYVWSEAAELLALPEDEVIEPGRFPLLDADIGSTINPLTNTVVENVREAAMTVKINRDAWLMIGAAIKATRMQYKRAISDAESHEDAYAILMGMTWPV